MFLKILVSFSFDFALVVSNLMSAVLAMWDLNSISTPGEVHISACLSSSKQEREIITPLEVAAMTTKNSKG